MTGNPYLEWGKPGDAQGERLFYVLLFGILAIVAAFVIAHDRGEPARSEHPHHCQAEDEMVVEVVEDAYDLRAGQTVCVHIDHINPEETR